MASLFALYEVNLIAVFGNTESDFDGQEYCAMRQGRHMRMNMSDDHEAMYVLRSGTISVISFAYR